MYELSREDNNRCYELEQDIFKVGDASVGIEASNLLSSDAQALRAQALETLRAARALLDRLYEAELDYVQHHTYDTQRMDIQ